MNKTWNPETLAAPLGSYSHCCEIPAGARILHIAGQVGVSPDGALMDGFEAQAEQTLRNIISILKANTMGPEDITKFGTYIVSREDLSLYSEIRNKVLGKIRPPGTLLVVSSLATAEMLIEVEAYAAKID